MISEGNVSEVAVPFTGFFSTFYTILLLLLFWNFHLKKKRKNVNILF